MNILLEGTGKVWRATGKGGLVIYIPADIIKDHSFPFKPKERVNVRLDPDRKQLIISKKKES